ncbi:hypothetical protein RQP46_000993 [Phenoliferia psychrophenolica]
MSQNSRWQARRGLGQFSSKNELSSQQQLLLAAVPRWKREWVRPSTLKPHQAPGFMVRKWVIDNSSDLQEGTEEEMAAAALIVVANGEGEGDDGPAGSGSVGATGPVTEASTPIPTSGTATPAVGDTADALVSIVETSSSSNIPPPLPLPTSLPITTTTADSTPTSSTPTIDSPLPSSTLPLPLPTNPSKPAEGPPPVPLEPALAAVAALQDVELPIPIDVEMGDVSTTGEEGEGKEFVEDEVLLAQEATSGTVVGMDEGEMA